MHDILRHTVEKIAVEKAGIMRAGVPAVCSDADPPASLPESARDIGATLYCLGRDFRVAQAGRTWHWQGPATQWQDLPWPALPGAHQLANAAGVIMAIAEAWSRGGPWRWQPSRYRAP